MLAWKQAPERKPLLLQGARQVGKTWLLNEFGRSEFEHCVLLDFAENQELRGLFTLNLKPQRILTDLSVYLNRDISLKDTLLIFDEIQICPEALTSLKYFCEAFPTAWICASGSLPGLGLSEQNFPVGKVRREWLRPMSYFEFLDALGETALREALSAASATTAEIAPAIHAKAFGFFKEYLITGGMPEVVSRYIAMRETRAAAFADVRRLQRELAESYLDDIAKHAGALKAALSTTSTLTTIRPAIPIASRILLGSTNRPTSSIETVALMETDYQTPLRWQERTGRPVA